MIFKKIMVTEHTTEWNYISYKYIMSQKYLWTALEIVKKHLLFNNYDIIKVYICTKQTVKDIKT